MRTDDAKQRSTICVIMAWNSRGFGVRFEPRCWPAARPRSAGKDGRRLRQQDSLHGHHAMPDIDEQSAAPDTIKNASGGPRHVGGGGAVPTAAVVMDGSVRPMSFGRQDRVFEPGTDAARATLRPALHHSAQGDAAGSCLCSAWPAGGCRAGLWIPAKAMLAQVLLGARLRPVVARQRHRQAVALFESWPRRRSRVAAARPQRHPRWPAKRPALAFGLAMSATRRRGEPARRLCGACDTIFAFLAMSGRATKSASPGATAWCFAIRSPGNVGGALWTGPASTRWRPAATRAGPPAGR